MQKFIWCQSIYTNPLTGCLGVHDPVMIKEAQTYHLFHTGRLTPHKTSADRIAWSCDGSAFSSSPSWVRQEVPDNNGTDYWAPDISFRDGKFWLYYSVSTFGEQTSAIGLATSPSLNNPDWQDEGVILASSPGDPFNAIDPNVIEDSEGGLWMNWGSWWEGIFLIALDRETGKTLAGAQPIHIAGRWPNGIEGSFIIYINHFYYLFTSWDRCCDGINSTYNIRIGRAEEVVGPFVDAEGTSLLSGGGTLLWDGDSRWIGPGHNGIFMENDSVFLVSHAYDAQANGASRLIIRLLYWTDDDWPTLDPDAGRATRIKTLAAPAAPEVRLIPVWNSHPRETKPLYDLKGKMHPSSPGQGPAPGLYLTREPYPPDPRANP